MKKTLLQRLEDRRSKIILDLVDTWNMEKIYKIQHKLSLIDNIILEENRKREII